VGTIRVGEVWLSVYPNDHEPPHVHAEIGAGKIVIDLLPDGNVALSTRKKAVRKATASEVRKALRAAETAYAELIELWEKTH
jgi:hypothetical protein